MVFLRGAYDAANIVVPVSSDFYYAARPNLAIAKDAALPLDSDWGLHPALKDSIYPLWQKKQIAFVPFAGTDDTSRSHFETQDTIELGQPVGGSAQLPSGFHEPHGAGPVGHNADRLHHPIAAELSAAAAPMPNIALNFAGKPGVAERECRLIQAMYQGQDLAPAVAQGFQVQNEVYQAISQRDDGRQPQCRHHQGL